MTIRQALRSLLGSWLKSFENDLGSAWPEIRGYWTAYGGFRSIVRSPVFLLAGFLTIAFHPLWWEGAWAEKTISIVPNLLGFTLGAMAIVLAFPGSRLFKFLVEKGRSDSYYLGLAARFVHFIFVQVFAILLALAGISYSSAILGFFGTWSLVYAILCAAMTGLALFGIAQMNNHPGAHSLLDRKD